MEAYGNDFLQVIHSQYTLEFNRMLVKDMGLLDPYCSGKLYGFMRLELH